MKNISYEDLERIALGAIEEALDTDDRELLSIGEAPCFDIFGIGEGVEIEIEFDNPTFSYPYYDGERVSLSLNVSAGEATLNVMMGIACSNPTLANEFIEMYMRSSRYKNVWQVTAMAEADSGLMLSAGFSFDGERELSEKLSETLSLFKNERFTNELRPFIHYFGD